MQTFIPVKAYCLLCLVFTHTLAAVAQRPPTGGPNPPTGPTGTKCKSCPVIFKAAGVAVAGAASYFTLRHFRTVPTGEQLATQLRRRGILPTADALNLMYTLNPGLKNQASMRRSRKLAWPELPPLSPPPPAAPAEQTSRALLENINAQMGLLQSNLIKFRGAGIAAENGNVNLGSVDAALGDVAQKAAAFKVKNEAGNAEQGQLLVDLLRALNGTLQQSIDTKRINAKNAAFIQSISENVTELLSPVAEAKPGADNRSGLYHQITPAHEQALYASLAAPTLFPAPYLGDRPRGAPGSRRRERADGQVPYASPAPTLGRNFAFAIYKIDSTGKAVTKGPEVEGKYYIYYAAPALVDDPSYFHRLTSLASFAYTSLYPAKYYLKVTTVSGKQVPLQNALIDVRDIFRDPKPAKIDNMIIIPIQITHD